MAILSVAVEANGWVLAVTGDWGATSGAFEYAGADRVNGRFMDGAVDQFPLNPDGTPKVTLTVERRGFTRSGGEAVPSVSDRQTLVATKALRKPYPDQTELDEILNGDGSRTVRLALSNRLYDGDEVTQISFAGGWKTGEGAALLVDCANHSSYPQPVAISRWAQPSYMLVKDTTKLQVDLIVASHHPRHFGALANQAVAAVKLTATDGTNTVGPFWFAAPQKSDQFDDALLCWGGEIDLEGLSPGPITIHHTSYPWVGAARSTGTAHSLDSDNLLKLAWETPLVVCYDPDGDLYPHRHVYVDAATGTTIAASVTVGTTLAAAKSGTAAKDISTACQALFGANYTLPARNGWAADTARAADWCVLTLAAGVHDSGSTAVTFGLSCNEGRVIVQGDPDDEDPRANCILKTQTTRPATRIARWLFRNMTLEAGESALLAVAMVHLDDVEVRGRPGYEAANTPLFQNTTPAATAALSMTRVLWWKYGLGVDLSNQACGLQRNCGVSRTSQGTVFINCWKPDDPLYPARSAYGYSFYTKGGTSDLMLWNCRADKWQGRFISLAQSQFSGTGTNGDPYVHKRIALINSLVERTDGAFATRIWSLGDSSKEQLQDSILEGGTWVGNSGNLFYNNDTGGVVDDLQHVGNVFRNMVWTRTAIKQDIFAEDGGRTGSWQHLYGVGYAGFCHANRIPQSFNFQYAWPGLGAAVDTDYANTATHDFLKFVDEKCDNQDVAAGAGGGDYHPGVGSPLLGRGAPANTDEDIEGVRRGTSLPSGVFASDLPFGVQLSASSSTHMSSSGEVALATAARVRPRLAVLGLDDAGVRLAAVGAIVRRRVGRTIEVEANARTLRVGRD